jgi:hypothetical protein
MKPFAGGLVERRETEHHGAAWPVRVKVAARVLPHTSSPSGFPVDPPIMQEDTPIPMPLKSCGLRKVGLR